MAKLITDNFQRNEVINALHHIDPASAQAEMLSYLQDNNVFVVLDILKYLREYGTKVHCLRWRNSTATRIRSSRIRLKRLSGASSSVENEKVS